MQVDKGSKKEEKEQDLQPAETQTEQRLEKTKSFLHVVVEISTVAWTMIASVAVGIFLGYWLDRWLSTGPLLLVIFSLLGVVSAIYYLYKFSRK